MTNRTKWKSALLARALPALLALGAASAGAPSAFGQYLGASDAVVLQPPGCNASAFAQVPGSSDLFVGRQLLTAEGAIAGVTGANDCSGGDPNNSKTGKIFNRWSLTLDRLDWRTRKFSIVKPLLDTSVDPDIRHSKTTISSGPMRGAIIRSAYDPYMVKYHDEYLMVFECTLENGGNYGVDGTSACLSVYDPSRQSLDLDRTQVIVSGAHADPAHFTAAAVPKLLVFRNHLYLYWSALSQAEGKTVRISMRGAEIESAPEGFSVKGSRGRLVRSMDEPATTEVWAPTPGDPLSDTTVDVTGLWLRGETVVAMASLGGSGCAAPSDKEKGCYRIAIAEAREPLAPHVFNQTDLAIDATFPSNAQEYSRPVRDEKGAYWLLGHWIKPAENGSSELRPAPGGSFWNNSRAQTVLAMLPLPSSSPWPGN